jgi:hypothetical protein
MAGAAAELADIGGPHCPPHDYPEADEQAGHHWKHCKTKEKSNWGNGIFLISPLKLEWRYQLLCWSEVTLRFHKTTFRGFFTEKNSWIFYICFGAISNKYLLRT